MVDKYLKPIGMEHLAKAFVENKITGSVLLNLEVGIEYHCLQAMAVRWCLCEVHPIMHCSLTFKPRGD